MQSTEIIAKTGCDFYETLFLLIEKDLQCEKWESKEVGKFKCSKPEPQKFTKEIIKKWSDRNNCRKKCLEHAKVMGNGCCEAKRLSIQMELPQPTSKTTNSSKSLYETECIFQSGANVEHIEISEAPAKTSNEDKTLACEGTSKLRLYEAF